MSDHKTNINKKLTTKNMKWVNNGEISKLIKQEELKNYLNNGWVIGMDDNYKLKISKSLIGKSPGKCLDPIKENERRQKISKSLKGNSNWKFNKRRGNSKQGWYKNIHCDSTWELAFLIYYFEHNLYVEKCNEIREYTYKNEKHLYFPDFITDEGIIEIKGRITDKSITKSEQNPDIIVYDKYKMEHILKYVIDKYGCDFWKTMYENDKI